MESVPAPKETVAQGPDASPAPAPCARLWHPSLIVFVSGACSMVLELVAGRIIAPYVGVSLYTWTSVIGVVLAVLSMQFLSSGLNMLQVSNFARELIWGGLLLFVMVINVTNWAGFRVLRAPPQTAPQGEKT